MYKSDKCYVNAPLARGILIGMIVSLAAVLVIAIGLWQSRAWLDGGESARRPLLPGSLVEVRDGEPSAQSLSPAQERVLHCEHALKKARIHYDASLRQQSISNEKKLQIRHDLAEAERDLAAAEAAQHRADSELKQAESHRAAQNDALVRADQTCRQTERFVEQARERIRSLFSRGQTLAENIRNSTTAKTLAAAKAQEATDSIESETAFARAEKTLELFARNSERKVQRVEEANSRDNDRLTSGGPQSVALSRSAEKLMQAAAAMADERRAREIIAICAAAVRRLATAKAAAAWRNVDAIEQRLGQLQDELRRTAARYRDAQRSYHAEYEQHVTAKETRLDLLTGLQNIDKQLQQLRKQLAEKEAAARHRDEAVALAKSSLHAAAGKVTLLHQEVSTAQQQLIEAEMERDRAKLLLSAEQGRGGKLDVNTAFYIR